MHGIIYSEFRKFVVQRWDGSMWQRILKNAGSQEAHYLIKKTYPDEDFMALIAATMETGEVPEHELLREFGVFIAPNLFKLYRSVIPDHWKTLDLLENTEGTIHKIVRMKTPGALPPMLSCKRKSAQEVLISYQSPRKMCALAEGIIQGVADIYDEKITIKQTGCMLHGDAKCLISITLDR